MSRDRTAGVATVIGVAGLVVGAATTVARSVPVESVPARSDHWAIVTSFTDYGLLAYLLGLVGLLVAVGTRRSGLRVGALALTVVLSVVHLSWLVPLFTSDPRPPAAASAFRLLTLNLKYGGADAAEVVRAAADVDVVVLAEANEPAHDRLLTAGLRTRFPYERVGSLPMTGGAGTTVFSRFPITRTEPLPAVISHQNWDLTVDVAGLGPIHLVAAHPVRPHVGGDDWADDQARLRTSLPRGPTVVAGDFNAVDNHLPVRRLAADGFRSTTDLAGAGWQPTYPADRRWLPPLVGIDHILLSPELTATTSRTVRIVGTDHLGVVATIARR